MKVKSIGAVFAGIAANFLAVPVDAVLHAFNLLPGPNDVSGELPYVLAFSYRFAFAVLGGWVTARLAPAAPMGHALVLSGVGLVLSSLGAAAQWSLGHHWYPLALISICIPASWAGAHLFTRSRS